MNVSKELQNICKELNGSVIKWKIGKLYVSAIILANPKEADRISIKPYEITPKEVSETYQKWLGIANYIDVPYASQKNFCFSTFDIATVNIPCFQRLIHAVKLGKGDFFEITDTLYGISPSCPY